MWSLLLFNTLMFELFIYQLNNEQLFYFMLTYYSFAYIMVYIYRFPKNELVTKKLIINMKRLEKDGKTKLFVPDLAATICTSHLEEEYLGVENILL